MRPPPSQTVPNVTTPTPVQPVAVEHLVVARQLLREGLATERARANRFLLACLAVYTLIVFAFGQLASYAPVILHATPDDQYAEVTFVMFVSLMVWVAGYVIILSMSRGWVSVSSKFLTSLQALAPEVLFPKGQPKKLRLAHLDECLALVERRLKDQLRELKTPAVSLVSSSEKIFHSIN